MESTYITKRQKLWPRTVWNPNSICRKDGT